jgi:hypothetical protein
MMWSTEYGTPYAVRQSSVCTRTPCWQIGALAEDLHASIIALTPPSPVGSADRNSTPTVERFPRAPIVNRTSTQALPGPRTSCTALGPFCTFGGSLPRGVELGWRGSGAVGGSWGPS